LNSDADRTAFSINEVERIELEENYRSTQSIIYLSEDALVTPANEHEERVTTLIDSLPRELYVEELVTLPLDIDGERVTISGIVDLTHVTDDAVEIIDYKTDRSDHAQPEYRKQLSVYYHVCSDWFGEMTVRPFLFYTATGTRTPIDPLSLSELRDIVRQQDQRD